METDPRLRVFACGGTFDKRYNPIDGSLVFGETQLSEVLVRARITLPYVVETLMLMDSLDMKDADRDRILAACRAAPERSLVIVHGTDTMPETARVIGPHVVDRTVVLTGAMVPYSISKSDAMFNLGFACACAQTLPAGTWIAMNGRVFAWDAVRKNRDEGRFEAA